MHVGKKDIGWWLIYLPLYFIFPGCCSPSPSVQQLEMLKQENAELRRENHELLKQNRAILHLLPPDNCPLLCDPKLCPNRAMHKED